MTIDINNLQALVFDFDGVLTDNAVYVDDTGRESVRCSRADGLAFDVLRTLPLQLFILSTEKNAVVTKRAEKLKVPVIQGQWNKSKTLQELARDKGFDLARTLYMGNDANDYHAMKLCGYRACPADSYPQILAIATHRLSTLGGHGVVRELVEEVLGIDIVKRMPV